MHHGSCDNYPNSIIVLVDFSSPQFRPFFFWVGWQYYLPCEMCGIGIFDFSQVSADVNHETPHQMTNKKKSLFVKAASSLILDSMDDRVLSYSNHVKLDGT